MTKNVISIESSMTVKDAAVMMENANVGSIVITEGNIPGGILTERDFVNRVVGKEITENCIICENKLHSAGPLWIGQLFDKKFIISMMEEIPKFVVDSKCEKILEKC